LKIFGVPHARETKVSSHPPLPPTTTTTPPQPPPALCSFTHLTHPFLSTDCRLVSQHADFRGAAGVRHPRARRRYIPRIRQHYTALSVVPLEACSSSVSVYIASLLGSTIQHYGLPFFSKLHRFCCDHLLSQSTIEHRQMSHREHQLCRQNHPSFGSTIEHQRMFLHRQHHLCRCECIARGYVCRHHLALHSGVFYLH
jgi:hypothetical protein